MPRFTPDQLLAKALSALDESYHQADKGPIPKSEHLRLTLAVLANSLDDRDPLDIFWRVATSEPISDVDAHVYGRRQTLGNAYAVIYRQLGLVPRH